MESPARLEQSFPSPVRESGLLYFSHSQQVHTHTYISSNQRAGLLSQHTYEDILQNVQMMKLKHQPIAALETKN